MKLETSLFLTDLTHLDCAWFDPVHGLVGETWRVDAQVHGELADNGMLCDFGHIKSVLKTALDAQFDHRLLLTHTQADCLVTEAAHQSIALRTQDGAEYAYKAPSQSFALMDCRAMQTTDVARALEAQLLGLLPQNILALKLNLLPIGEPGAYRYCHGLHQHEGNCQRMAHGHRATLKIWLDDTRNASLEAAWQKRFNHRYIGSAEHLTVHGKRHAYSYQGSQGDFYLELPENRSCPIDAEPTIEHMSRYIVQQIARDHRSQHIRCRAFEGIGKGACSELST